MISAHSDKSTSFASLTRKANFRLSECRARWKAAAQGHPLGDRLLLLPLTRAARASSHWNHWRSLGNRVSKVKSTIWAHKQLYPRSLSVKGFSLHLQTVSLIAVPWRYWRSRRSGMTSTCSSSSASRSRRSARGHDDQDQARLARLGARGYRGGQFPTLYLAATSVGSNAYAVNCVQATSARSNTALPGPVRSVIATW